MATPSPKARSILAALALTGAGFNVVMAFLAPFALRHGIQAVHGFFISYTLAALGIRVLGGALTDRLGFRRTATLGIILYGIVVAGIGLVASSISTPVRRYCAIEWFPRVPRATRKTVQP